ncbi:MAG: hypothetical protein LBQ50_13590 [Planctomycetaceae bacterium]|jgi:lactate dehydrogenase-like 2-hydroxyacid dehydrogenase|nr:hypothetical protein [Planctomycetaceae bacterium]
MKTILVTNKEYVKASTVFSGYSKSTILPVPSDESDLAESVRKYAARCVIAGVEKYTGLLYEALREVTENSGSKNNSYGSLIARFGAGHDGIDKKLARQYGIAVTNTPGVLSRSVAEHTFWLMGSLFRNIIKGDNTMRSGTFPSLSGFELGGKTLLIVGAGGIGRQVARIARFGFGMYVFAVGSCPLHEFSERQQVSPERFLNENGIERYSHEIDLLLPEADVVSLHLASTPQTFHFVSKSRINLMKPSAVLINTARGAVVDEAALFEALVTNRIAGAGLDVFESEPYKPVTPDSDFRTLNNVVLTPHLGSSSVEANHRMAELTLKNAELFFEQQFDKMNLVH